MSVEDREACGVKSRVEFFEKLATSLGRPCERGESRSNISPSRSTLVKEVVQKLTSPTMHAKVSENCSPQSIVVSQGKVRNTVELFAEVLEDGRETKRRKIITEISGAMNGDSTSQDALMSEKLSKSEGNFDACCVDLDSTAENLDVAGHTNTDVSLTAECQHAMAQPDSNQSSSSSSSDTNQQEQVEKKLPAAHQDFGDGISTTSPAVHDMKSAEENVGTDAAKAIMQEIPDSRKNEENAGNIEFHDTQCSSITLDQQELSLGCVVSPSRDVKLAGTVVRVSARVVYTHMHVNAYVRMCRQECCVCFLSCAFMCT
jgi:hypothetical protein